MYKPSFNISPERALELAARARQHRDLAREQELTRPVLALRHITAAIMIEDAIIACANRVIAEASRT